MRERRPLIAVPARFSASASALRYEAEVNARKLIAAVYAAGGEPVSVHPHAPGGAVTDDEVAFRLRFADGLLLPGGGDLSAHWTGQSAHPSLYDVDEEQDAFDLAAARAALDGGLPLLAVCRGLQVVSTALGGTLHLDLKELDGQGGAGGQGGAHWNRMRQVTAEPGSVLADAAGTELTVSCYHHQCVDALGAGLRAAARSGDGVVEAVTSDRGEGWFLGVQWHPEDTFDTDPRQLAIFTAHVDAARKYAAER
ncbi:gamma-glutamyl-gamma-aminobutyrate hydrolase family protein [Glycomyces sp. YM15]|uniref:gamma-glutamyl-gamma-aminobutyrate hydrolase family protein n=1 Tax=Glycomyces sp. YM15 TaxID=2800446 RepID=UPI001965B7A1|nr:gamma-glutamyl-gamma-aminobutyrate hydrolase family protein [Glycomyces sp. YM15]